MRRFCFAVFAPQRGALVIDHDDLAAGQTKHQVNRSVPISSGGSRTGNRRFDEPLCLGVLLLDPFHKSLAG